ncbi:hypothetical protein C8Q70DRAFT_196595 [Cubamyces menziesii]|nr:hypothetical protein C8Q70DRAFT_196595 [Cubamyces menziesii]
MSLLKAWKSVSSVNGPGTPPDSPTPLKKGRFSLFQRQSPPRRAAAAHASFRSEGGGEDDAAFWTVSPSEIGRLGLDSSRRGGRADDRGGEGDVTLERSFTLSVLEGRKALEARRSTRGSTGTSTTCISQGSGDSPASGSSLRISPPPIPPRSRARSASVSSNRSICTEEGRRRLKPRPQTLGVPELEEPELGEDTGNVHPPTYSCSAYPVHAVTYRFVSTGPFAMALEPEEGKGDVMGLWRYRVSVGVNVLTLRSWVTSIRRGGEDGLLVAEIESGISSGNATVTMEEASRSSRDVLSRTVGSKMYYIGDGTSIRWNLGETQWEAFFDSVALATFEPGCSRKLVMQPIGHRFFDHIVVGLLLLMREKEEGPSAKETKEDTGPLSPPFLS